MNAEALVVFPNVREVIRSRRYIRIGLTPRQIPGSNLVTRPRHNSFYPRHCFMAMYLWEPHMNPTSHGPTQAEGERSTRSRTPARQESECPAGRVTLIYVRLTIRANVQPKALPSPFWLIFHVVSLAGANPGVPLLYDMGLGLFSEFFRIVCASGPRRSSVHIQPTTPTFPNVSDPFNMLGHQFSIPASESLAEASTSILGRITYITRPAIEGSLLFGSLS
ncbi:uncharacterized protein EI90DRAFT_249657 [Cantharellus anzutake]|uniref:uncharacterized protein n=1 Tax=Cantharellus anzutake TaxID=1750568 RepID=UPI00190394A0|nr:uncharacterized protein EI90DRAFT_249657 [Cantharellus anzutake]KAF8335722.1 hypothetical protein EI90DRAFT_249657 [Cantharellus anzutake]